MEDKELSIILRDRARELGLCEKWYKDWKKHTSQQELIEKYLKGIDFCIKHDYPKLAFIKKYFDRKVLLRNGIFADEEVRGDNLRTVVMLGTSNGSLHYSELSAGKVYVRHQSMVAIVADRGAKVFVETYDDCVVNIVTDDTSKVFVYNHGGIIKHDGNVIVRDRTEVES